MFPSQRQEPNRSIRARAQMNEALRCHAIDALSLRGKSRTNVTGTLGSRYRPMTPREHRIRDDGPNGGRRSDMRHGVRMTSTAICS